MVAFLALECAPCAYAQASWPAYLQEWKDSKATRRPWTLRVRQGDQKETWWRRDDALALLVADKELNIESLEKEKAATLWQLKDWGTSPHWLLIGRTGEKLFEGEGTPKGEEILAAIHAGGEKTSWEQRETFLRNNPENGEALEARLSTSLLLAGYRYRVLIASNQATPFRLGSPGKILLGSNEASPAADLVFSETSETLERLLALPDGWRLSASTVFLFGLALRSFDAGASPRLSGLLHRMRAAALDQWSRNPQRSATLDPQTLYGASALWASCEWILGKGTISTLPRLTVSPGRIYPQSDLLLFVANEIRDPETLLEFLASVPTDPPEGTVSPAQWQTFMERQACLTGLYTLAYAQLARWDQAQIALQECRRWAGNRWKGLTLVDSFEKEFEKGAARQQTPASGKEEIPQGPPKEFMSILRGNPEPDLKQPRPPQEIRMVLWGKPNWSMDWRKLGASGPIGAWNSDELTWRPANKDDEAVMSNLGWSQPRWAAFQGPSSILASGSTLPDPRFLALQLAAGGQPRLLRLNTFIRQNPEHEGARQDRFDLVRKRMPNPALEPLLAEDASRAWIRLDFNREAQWLSDPAPFEAQAIKLMPEVEAAIRRWPSSRQLWSLWLSWLPFGGSPLSPHAFALSVAVPRPQNEWLADLPKELHVAVAEELRRKARFSQMRAWFQVAWDGAMQRVDDPGGCREVIYGALAEAMLALHQKGPLQELIIQHDKLRKQP